MVSCRGALCIIGMDEDMKEVVRRIGEEKMIFADDLMVWRKVKGKCRNSFKNKWEDLINGDDKGEEAGLVLRGEERRW